jgi:hypothetical protein
MFSRSNKKIGIEIFVSSREVCYISHHQFVAQLGPISSLSVFNYARNNFLNKRELRKKDLFFKEVLRARFV